MNAREAALAALTAVEREKAYSNVAMTRALSGARLSARDAALATEIVYGTLQYQATIDAALGPLLSRPLAQVDLVVRQLLRLSLYQIAFLDRVPAHAAVHEAVEIAKRVAPKAQGFVNGVLRKGVSTVRSFVEELSRRAAEGTDPSLWSLAYSHPEWLIREWQQSLGTDAARALCEANNARPPLFLRVNRERATVEQVLAMLDAQGVSAVRGKVGPTVLVDRSGFDPSAHDAYFDGWYTVQDMSSTVAGLAVHPEPGQRVFDACAAPGGKTTHLAEMMGDKGEIISCDVHESKTRMIREASARLGLRSIRVVSGDAAEVGLEHGPYDVVLLDAPCSGFGVVRRRPEIKWRKSRRDVDQLCAEQRRLLDALANTVKPGGILVYTTCTVQRAENDFQVESFLSRDARFALEPVTPFVGEASTFVSEKGYLQLLPQQMNSDGFFIARFRRLK